MLSAEPFIFASVTIQTKNPVKFLKGDLSNDKGLFSLETPSKNTYWVKIEYVGYKTKIIEINSDDYQTLELGAITLSQLLESVTVSGQKRTVLSGSTVGYIYPPF